MSRAVVVGGGIAGMCAAFDLGRAGWHVDVYESSGRLGGKIHSSPVGDRLVDAGPDTFLARAESGVALCRDLGILDELTSPVAPVPAYLVRNHQLHELPISVLGVPVDLDHLAATGLISPGGIARAASDLSREPTEIAGDISVGELCRDRLGDEVTDRLVDPILGGINASDIDRLSLRAGAPMLAAALERGPSLIEGLRSLRPASGSAFGAPSDAPPVFHGLPGGIVRIVEAIGDSLSDTVSVHLNHPVDALDDLGPADAFVVAVPAPAAARLVAPRSPEAAAGLASIEYASVAQAVVEIPVSGVERVLDASGILFPRVDGTVLTACTWLSTKWAHYHRDESVLLRLSSGRFGDERITGLDDEQLVEILLGELSEVVKIGAAPIASRVMRWNDSLPQYTPGHSERVDTVHQALAVDAPTHRLVGAAYGGIGIPACIDSGRTAARSVLDGR